MLVVSGGSQSVSGVVASVVVWGALLLVVSGRSQCGCVGSRSAAVLLVHAVGCEWRHTIGCVLVRRVHGEQSSRCFVVSGGSQSMVWNAVRWLVVGVLIIGCEWGLTTNDTGLSVGGWLLPLLSLVVSGRSQPVVFLCVGAGTAIVNLFCCESRLTADACRRPSDPWQVTSENSTDAGHIPETDIRLLRGGYRE